ncbi:sporulation histidine kinase inhibitor Sda [Brevibacillus fluminis]
MRYLSDQMLLEVYRRAVSLQLETDFINLIYEELERRSLVDALVTA